MIKRKQPLPKNPLTLEERDATAVLRKPTGAFWQHFDPGMPIPEVRVDLPINSVPVDVREIRAAGSLDDFKDGMGQALLNLFLAFNLGGTRIGLYVYGTTFVRLALIEIGMACDNKPADEELIVVEDKGLSDHELGWSQAELPRQFVQRDYRDNMPCRLYDPVLDNR